MIKLYTVYSELAPGDEVVGHFLKFENAQKAMRLWPYSCHKESELLDDEYEEMELSLLPFRVAVSFRTEKVSYFSQLDPISVKDENIQFPSHQFEKLFLFICVLAEDKERAQELALEYFRQQKSFEISQLDSKLGIKDWYDL